MRRVPRRGVREPTVAGKRPPAAPTFFLSTNLGLDFVDATRYGKDRLLLLSPLPIPAAVRHSLSKLAAADIAAASASSTGHRACRVAIGATAEEGRLTLVNLTASTFEELNLSPPMLAAVHAAGYRIPTPIQASTIQPALAGQCTRAGDRYDSKPGRSRRHSSLRLHKAAGLAAAFLKCKEGAPVLRKPCRLKQSPPV